MAGRLAIQLEFMIVREHCGGMTHEEAIAEVARIQAADPEATWVAVGRENEWVIARVGLPPTPKPRGKATNAKPPPVAPRDDPHSAIERAAWFAAG